MYPWSNDVKEIAPFLFCALFSVCHVFEMPCYFFNKSHLVLSQHFNCRQLLIELVWYWHLREPSFWSLWDVALVFGANTLPFLHWLNPAPRGAPNESYSTCVWECKIIRSAWILEWQKGKAMSYVRIMNSIMGIFSCI